MDFNWISFALGSITGGSGLKLIDYLILLRKEKREQHSLATSKEKDRPRFRVDVSIVPTSNLAVNEAVVKVLSLGGLPLTIDDGEAFIEASHYPKHVQPQKLHNREISSASPIELKFSLPNKLIHPPDVGEPTVKLVCNFSCGKDRYHNEKTYNRSLRNFE